MSSICIAHKCTLKNYYCAVVCVLLLLLLDAFLDFDGTWKVEMKSHHARWYGADQTIRPLCACAHVWVGRRQSLAMWFRHWVKAIKIKAQNIAIAYKMVTDWMQYMRCLHWLDSSRDFERYLFGVRTLMGPTSACFKSTDTHIQLKTSKNMWWIYLTTCTFYCGRS